MNTFWSRLWDIVRWLLDPLSVIPAEGEKPKLPPLTPPEKRTTETTQPGREGTDDHTSAASR